MMISSKKKSDGSGLFWTQMAASSAGIFDRMWQPRRQSRNLWSDVTQPNG
jgi:hypothetical protein